MKIKANHYRTLSMAMTTQSAIYAGIESMIPAALWNEYSHLSFGEMANQPELRDWAEELEQADADWFSSEQ